MLEAVELFDQSLGLDRALHYAAGDAQREGSLGRFPTAGKVKARMCPACGRIVLYGEPHEQSS
jgi:hypothetical protein